MVRLSLSDRFSVSESVRFVDCIEPPSLIVNLCASPHQRLIRSTVSLSSSFAPPCAMVAVASAPLRLFDSESSSQPLLSALASLLSQRDVSQLFCQPHIDLRLRVTQMVLEIAMMPVCVCGAHRMSATLRCRCAFAMAAVSRVRCELAAVAAAFQRRVGQPRPTRKVSETLVRTRCIHRQAISAAVL